MIHSPLAHVLPDDLADAWPLVLGLALLVCGAVAYAALRGRSAPGVEGLPADVELRWTRHVRERMEQRSITPEAVELTLRAPAARTHDPAENSWRYERTFGTRTAGELVKVWVSADVWPPQGEVVVKSTAAQRFAEVTVPRAKVGQVIGHGGATVTRIRRETGARIDVGNDGRVRITADNLEQVARARALVRAVARG